MAIQNAQDKFNTSLKFSCSLVDHDSIYKCASADVFELHLPQALPSTYSLFGLLQRLPNLQVLDISGNYIGAVSLRSLMLAMSHNVTITTLLAADNQADTDTAESIGEMLSKNCTLKILDLSGNYLGKDYFSRCVGPTLSKNKSLTILKCETIGSTDLNVLAENLVKNSALTSLNLNYNEMTDSSKFIKELTKALTTVTCCLKSIQLKNCGLKSVDIVSITSSLTSNKCLETLDISGAEAQSSVELLNFFLGCIKHSALKTLNCDDIKLSTVTDWTSPSERVSVKSQLQFVSLIGCKLQDNHLVKLAQYVGDGALPNLTELNLASNNITGDVLKVFKSLTKQGLQKLNFDLNDAQKLPDALTGPAFPKLEYLNLRRAQISTEELSKLSALLSSSLVTLVLDGIKLAGTGVIKTLFDNKKLKLAALSVSNCQVDDADVTPVSSACVAGTPLQMLKLSGNRLTSAAICHLCDALEKSKLSPHPLQLMDFSNNQVDKVGALRLASLLTSKKVQLQSVNLSNNIIDTEGLVGLAGCVASTSLMALNLSSQQGEFDEEHINQIYKSLIKSLGLKVIEVNGQIESGSCPCPTISSSFSVKLKALGGIPGELGKVVHCPAIETDLPNIRKPYLLLHHILEICAYLQGQTTPVCALSKAEFDQIISAVKDAPSWLQIAKHRDLAVLMTNLPSSITTQKLEGTLENEADCLVDEIYLQKDLVTKSNNGVAWVLLSNEDSVQRALKLFNRCEALVYSQPFTISRLVVNIDDKASTEAEIKAKQDMAQRQQERRKDLAAHQQLIEQSYYESQARHAYRLAHPAYADGRVW